MTYTITLDQFSGPLEPPFGFNRRRAAWYFQNFNYEGNWWIFKFILINFKKKNHQKLLISLHGNQLVYIKSTILLPYINPEDEQRIFRSWKRASALLKNFRATRLSEKFWRKELFILARKILFKAAVSLCRPRTSTRKRFWGF